MEFVSGEIITASSDLFKKEIVGEVAKLYGNSLLLNIIKVHEKDEYKAYSLGYIVVVRKRDCLGVLERLEIEEGSEAESK